jgi:tetratricopeptide (TPR) repeat protein
MSRAHNHRLATLVTLASLSVQLAAPPLFAQSTETPQQQAVEQLANLAYEQHAAGKYAESIATYLKAYEISKASDILFNVATIYDRKLHERELAADYYRRYIRTQDPNPDLVKRATERLTGLKKEAEEEQAKRNAGPSPRGTSSGNATQGTAGAPAGPTAEEREASVKAARTWHTAGIIVAATGMAGVVGSLALGAFAKAKNDAANKVCNGLECTTQQGVDDAHTAGTFATASTITFAAGMGLTAIGVTLFFAAPKPLSASSARVTIGPQVSTTGGGMSVFGSF